VHALPPHILDAGVSFEWQNAGRMITIYTGLHIVLFLDVHLKANFPA
jgi:hypothetical protein